ncbi:MAG: cohesin domain-containing protein [Tepidibacter sp.]|jgi:hypothetical protein|uniref:cohesin domain-containing protein n=1 Tax=Tepidibacter sp. TaxID=2529387 RepID=UPI0026013E5F|nr:cohesin domain-containing protein [Tepidibacter sp.]MCT4508076.1 cohesin domain-containing protein [Tepidibacter sp.]
MKKNIRFKAIILSFLLIVLSFNTVFANNEVNSSNEKEVENEWIGVDNGGLNFDSSKNTETVDLKVYNNELYACWGEMNSNDIYKTRVKKYDGSKWIEVDNGGLNFNSTRSPIYPKLEVYNNELYSIWQEKAEEVNQIRVKKYDGSKWIGVDDGGLKFDLSKHVNGNLDLKVYNNKLYAIWNEDEGNRIYQLRVKKYNGSKWVGVDNGGLNFDSSRETYAPNLEVYNNELYATWTEINSMDITQIRIKKYDGIKWIGIDDGGLNIDSSKYANNSNLKIYNNELYVTWIEQNISHNYQIRVKKLVNNTNKLIINIKPEKEKIRVNEEVMASLSIDNVNNIYAQDIRVKYDSNLLEYIGPAKELEGIKIVDEKEVKKGELRFILGSKGSSNVINDKTDSIKLKFRGKQAGSAKVDITKGRIATIEKEWEVEEKGCGETTIVIEGLQDVNKSGEFTLVDLAIDFSYYGLNATDTDTNKYDADVVKDDEINDVDLKVIAQAMKNNPNYQPNKY